MTNDKNACRPLDDNELAAVSGGVSYGGICGANDSGISNCDNGGGVYVSGDYPCGNGGAFIGGVSGVDNSSFSMSDGASISGNTIGGGLR